MYKMTHDEMRQCRREWINYYLLCGFTSQSLITSLVRFVEMESWGEELKAYG